MSSKNRHIHLFSVYKNILDHHAENIRRAIKENDAKKDSETIEKKDDSPLAKVRTRGENFVSILTRLTSEGDNTNDIATPSSASFHGFENRIVKPKVVQDPNISTDTKSRRESKVAESDTTPKIDKKSKTVSKDGENTKFMIADPSQLNKYKVIKKKKEEPLKTVVFEFREKYEKYNPYLVTHIDKQF